jgi:radical SAM protein with 4Fe4S-binding SPASM domain
MHPLLKGGLRVMEKPLLYHPRRDELYELDEDALEFISFCTGRNSLEDILRLTGSDKAEAMELISYLQGEGLIVDKRVPWAPTRHRVLRQSTPSLRYLQLHVTERCNLNCRHCYLGSKESVDLPLPLAKEAVREFSKIGLKLLITGGEPLLYPHLWGLLRYARKYPIRVEVLSNGTLVTPSLAAGLARYVDCVQISLDGLRRGHDLIRGEGAFERAIQGIQHLVPYVDVSIATMIHAGNLEEFPALEALINRLGAKEWCLDVPSAKGNMARNKDLQPELKAAAQVYGRYGFGGEAHEGHAEFSCGAHLCSVSVTGEITKCGFFTEGVGNLGEIGLWRGWQRITRQYLPRLSQLECRGCESLEDCRGGCRYRAEEARDFYGKDPFMCVLYHG